MSKNLFLLEKKYDENGYVAKDAKIFRINDKKILTLQGNGTVTLEDESNLFEIIFLDGNIFKNFKSITK